MMIFGCCACGKNESNSKSVEDRVCEEVKFAVMAKLASVDNYDSFDDITYSVKENGENRFEISGKATYKDKYSKIFTKTYDAWMEYNPETDSIDYQMENVIIH